MRKKIGRLMLLAWLLASLNMTAYAETSHGNPDWSVVFTKDKKMETNFKTSDIDDAIYGLQPGDNVIISLKLKNENKSATDWYMTNKVLYSLEDRSKNSATSGGAYTYKLTYKGPDGKTDILFDSESVGGEGESKVGEGLKQATNGLEDYFYLDTLKSGNSGEITLEVALEGDTQGNDYQDTLADLQMNFAVELNESGTDTPTPGTGRRTRAVQTGDDLSLTPFIITASVTGTLLMIFAVYSQRQREKEKKQRARRRARRHEDI